MPINTREDYIEIGTSVNADKSLNNLLLIPVPNSQPFSNEFIAEAERNANGTMIIQQIGRTQHKMSLELGTLKNTKWWEINRWFETYGYVFYMKFFDNSVGRVKVQRFYRGNINQAEPNGETEIINGYTVPKKYKNCGFSIIDMGENDVKIISEMGI